jgi:hypothetical protein
MVEMSSGNNTFAKQGQEYLAKANKTKSGSFFGNLFGSKEQRLDEARDLY